MIPLASLALIIGGAVGLVLGGLAWLGWRTDLATYRANLVEDQGDDSV